MGPTGDERRETRDGRRTRFERLTLPVAGDLRYAAQAMSSQDADDLVQETYLRAYRSFDTYRTDDNIRGWLFTILRNAYLDHCRRKRIEPVFAQIESHPPAAPEPAASARLEEALPDDVLRALQSLTPAHRLLVLFADIERLSYREIADVVGGPIGSVMSGLHNARSRLRDLLLAMPKSRV